VRTSVCRRRMFLDAAPNGANRGWIARGYKDFAPTELIRESFIARGIKTPAVVFGGGTVSRRLFARWVVSSRDQGSRG
jgi:hypothetical protein